MTALAALSTHRIRPATRADAEPLAQLIHRASHGLAFAVWRDLADAGEDPWAVGRRRVERDEGGSSWRNARVLIRDGDVAAALIGYPVGDEPDEVGPETPALFRPLIELENAALGTWYVNVLATFETHRRSGAARALIEDAATSRAEGRDLTLIVADDNHEARRCYAALGFEEAARKPVAVGLGWRPDSREWILMRRRAGGRSG